LRLASVLPPLPPSWALELGAEDFYDPQGWTAGLGPFEKPCDPPNPRETFFGRPEKAASPMIELRTASSDVMCCQCASRTRSIPMNRTLRARDAYLYGVFQTDRGPSDTFSVASMQIDLNLRGSRQGSAVFASENRPNNNCAGTDQRPEKLLKGAFSSQILSMIADVEFDEILVRLQGYGCGPASNRVAIALNVRQPGDVAMNPRDGSEYVWIPPGEFEMGCSKDDNECFDDEKPVHRVRISRGFWIGRTEATVAVWNRLAARSDRPGVKGAPREPATSVSWTQAAGHCTAAGGRLPTEAEWEYAARAGTTTARYGNLNEIAWHGSNSGGRVHEVATRAPNAWGLYDMLGNVYEWVADDYRPYEARTQTDPGGPGTGRSKVLRGGSWFNLPRLARASDRYSYDLEYGNVGLRCVWDAGRRFSP
jgi:formylglycine-generating enzyme required for sulfatase activity